MSRSGLSEQKEPDRISEMELFKFGFTENKDMSFPRFSIPARKEYIVENVNDSFDDGSGRCKLQF